MLNIALDGPAGAGKSTVAKALSERLKITYLDTGAMYRAAALFFLEHGTEITEEGAKEILDAIHIDIRYEGGIQKIFLNGKDVGEKIREHRISKAASDVSALPSVRKKLVELQQEIARKTPCVLDGRDIGTVVLPNAEYKFFITAEPEVRAMRRFRELTEKGQNVTFEKVFSDINTRDYNDSHRACSPLKRAEDAVLIDTTDLSAEEVVEEILKRIGEK